MPSPLDLLRHHVTGAIERGEAVAIVEEPAYDVEFTNHGSIVTCRSITDRGDTWMDEYLSVEPWQMMGDAVCMEPRYVADIALGMEEDGIRHNLIVEAR